MEKKYDNPYRNLEKHINRLWKQTKRTISTIRYLFWSNRAVIGSVSFARRYLNKFFDTPTIDLVIVLPPTANQGWILDAICREVGAEMHDWEVVYCAVDEVFPVAKRYFFSHYMFYFQSLSLGHLLMGASSYVFATHLESAKHGLSDRAVARLLHYCDGVICMNQSLSRELNSLGVNQSKLHVAICGADQAVFESHDRTGDGMVGFCSAYYPRKSPDLIIELVKKMPSRSFLLIGKAWDAHPKFGEMLNLPNFKYVDTDYDDYPSHYAQMSVFVSPSRLEGGPIPLLEAMMSNVVPVASRTGFAPDIIVHGENGYLFDIGQSVGSICRLIDEAFALNCDVRSSVEAYTWSSFARAVRRVIELN